jgi:putative glycosyltransferase
MHNDNDPPVLQQVERRQLDLSIVTTLYKSAPFIQEFYRRVTGTADKITDSYELVLVNDGSPDHSLQLAIALADADPRVRVVDLSRNFGHHAAVLAGLRNTRGKLVYLTDIDLEEQPEWLADFWNDIHETPADVVFGVQTARAGSLAKRYTGSLFYTLFNLASDIPIPPDLCTVRLMKRSYVEAIQQFTEAHLFWGGLFAWAGFTQRSRSVTKSVRAGKSTYTPLRLLQLFVNAVTSFSSYPLTVVFVLGTFVTLLSTIYALQLLILKWLRPEMIVSGFTSILVSIWFIGGFVVSVLGLIGMYIGKIFTETKARPQYMIRSIYERHQ